jgi:ribokinase
MYGAVGRDSFADPALALLVGGGVDLSGVARTDAPTGCATILVDSAGENCIAVAAGANERVHPDAVPDSVLTPKTLLVLQQEVPATANVAARSCASAPGRGRC